jgi:hypothetical protein
MCAATHEGIDKSPGIILPAATEVANRLDRVAFSLHGQVDL